jgi:anionic cell wall polymer biosynthesis LytR-Cps2A-Psr (LCP) family protein
MRYEDPNGDYGRQKRQQQVIQAIIKKVNAKKSVSLYKKLLKLVSNNMRTNLSFSDMLKLATDDQAATKNIKKYTLQGVGAYINEESYQVPTTKELQKVSNQLRSELGLAQETLSNTNTKLNKLNTAAGFDWSGDNPTYTLYTSDSTSTDTTTTTTEAGGYNTTGTTTGAGTGGPSAQPMQ